MFLYHLQRVAGVSYAEVVGYHQTVWQFSSLGRVFTNMVAVLAMVAVTAMAVVSEVGLAMALTVALVVAMYSGWSGLSQHRGLFETQAHVRLHGEEEINQHIT